MVVGEGGGAEQAALPPFGGGGAAGTGGMEGQGNRVEECCGEEWEVGGCGVSLGPGGG